MSATTYSPTHFRVKYRPATGSILGLRRLAEGSHVGQVLRPTGGQLVDNQIRAPNKKRLEPAVRVNQDFYPIPPRILEINAVDLRQYVHGDRCASHAKELISFGEIGRDEPF